jgi:hypothetical protein
VVQLLDGVFGKRRLVRPVCRDDHQAQYYWLARSRRQQIHGRVVGPMKIFEYQNQRLRLRQKAQQAADLPQHAFARRAKNLPLQ